MTSPVDLLRALVRIPSVSGSEEAVRDHLVAWLREQGVEARASGRNVVAVREGKAAGDRGLLLLTHIDVVPPGEGWTRDPWDAALEDGRVYGRGANDAKASVAAMAWAAARVPPRSLAGRLVLALVCDEETGGEGIEALADELPPYDAVVVGEPTELDVCHGQRGLLRAAVVCRGRAAHASRPWEGENALFGAARDLLAIRDLDLGEPDPLLGPATLQPTVLRAGSRANVLPGECTIELDGRLTPACDADAMLERLRSAVAGEVVVRSRRFEPVLVPPESEIVRVATAASPTGRLRAFGGLSDLNHVSRVPGVVMGPGTSAASHAPDEWVAVEQVEAAVGAYARIVRAYLGRAGEEG